VLVGPTRELCSSPAEWKSVPTSVTQALGIVTNC
jgi:hypothetical protein